MINCILARLTESLENRKQLLTILHFFSLAIKDTNHSNNDFITQEVDMDFNCDPKYDDVKADIATWVSNNEKNNTLLKRVALKLLAFFPTEEDFTNNFGLINNFVLMVFDEIILINVVTIITTGFIA
jgi:hypothetical protein